MDASDHDGGNGIDGEEHLRARGGVAHVVGFRVAGHLRHPRRVRAGAEHLARAGHHDHAQHAIVVGSVRPGGQFSNDVLVERVADVRAVQRDLLDWATPIDREELIAHLRRLFHWIGSCKPPHWRKT